LRLRMNSLPLNKKYLPADEIQEANELEKEE
jgi:hypothetical protein